jgi:hypothetical protein
VWAARQPPSSPRPRRGVAQEGPDDEADGVVAQDATGRAGREDVRQVRLAGGGRHGDSCGGLQRASPAALRSAGRASPRLASPGSGLWSAGGGGGEPSAGTPGSWPRTLNFWRAPGQTCDRYHYLFICLRHGPRNGAPGSHDTS